MMQEDFYRWFYNICIRQYMYKFSNSLVTVTCYLARRTERLLLTVTGIFSSPPEAVQSVLISILSVCTLAYLKNLTAQATEDSAAQHNVVIDYCGDPGELSGGCVCPQNNL